MICLYHAFIKALLRRSRIKCRYLVSLAFIAGQHVRPLGIQFLDSDLCSLRAFRCPLFFRLKITATARQAH